MLPPIPSDSLEIDIVAEGFQKPAEPSMWNSSLGLLMGRGLNCASAGAAVNASAAARMPISRYGPLVGMSL